MQKTFKEAMMDMWDALIPMVGLNLIWFVLTILVVTAFPATGALYYATNRIAHGEAAGTGTFFEGFKEQFWTSWKWGIINLIIYSLLIMNIWFYGQFEGWFFLILQSLFFSFTLIYTSMLIYVYPFLLEQEQPSLRVAIRNSFAVFVRFMVRSFGLLIFIILLVVVSIILPPLWILVTGSVILYLANWQTIQFIRLLKDEDQKKTENKDQEST